MLIDLIGTVGGLGTTTLAVAGAVVTSGEACAYQRHEQLHWVAGQPVPDDPAELGTVTVGDEPFRFTDIAPEWGVGRKRIPGRTRLLVVTNSYVSIRVAQGWLDEADGWIFRPFPQRALGHADMIEALGVEPRVTVPYDPSIPRQVDAGLLSVRPTRTLTRAIDALVQGVTPCRSN